MGKAGAIKDGFARGATAQQVELAKALQGIHRVIIGGNPKLRSSRAISEDIHVTEQHYSNFLHAQRQPTDQEARRLLQLAEEALAHVQAMDPSIVVLHKYEELQRLQELAIMPCGRCRTWHEAVVEDEVERRLAVRSDADDGNSGRVPVPLAEGDRHPGPKPSPPPWGALAEVRQLAEDGSDAELLTLLGHVGADTDPDDLPSIMHTLGAARLDAAAEVVTNAAAARPADVILEIAHKLHEYGMDEELGRLLSAASAASRS